MTHERLRRQIESHCGKISYDFVDKRTSIIDNLIYMFNRTAHIFEWLNLPDTIPSRMLELYLQLNGNACFYPYNDKLYVFQGGRGGEPDEYYQPTIYTISNPALNLTAQPRIGIECVVMPNDTFYTGLLPLFRKVATMMTENELSMQMAIIMTRMPAIITSDTDSDTKAGEKYIQDIIDGKLSIYPKSNILQSVNTHPIAQASAQTLTDLIETQQYLKASWYNDIGLNANYNMKREAINTHEAQLNKRALFTLVADMYENRRLYATKVNDMFGTSISVTYSDVWNSEYEELVDPNDKNDNPTDLDIATEGGESDESHNEG